MSIKNQILDEIKKYQVTMEVPEHISPTETDTSEETICKMIFQVIKDEIILTKTVDQNTGKHVLIGTIETVDSEKIEKIFKEKVK